MKWPYENFFEKKSVKIFIGILAGMYIFFFTAGWWLIPLIIPNISDNTMFTLLLIFVAPFLVLTILGLIGMGVSAAIMIPVCILFASENERNELELKRPTLGRIFLLAWITFGIYMLSTDQFGYYLTFSVFVGFIAYLYNH